MPKSSPLPKYLFDKDPWILGEEIPDNDIFFFQIPMSYFTNDVAYPFIKPYKRSLTHYKKFHSNFYVAEKDSFEVAEVIVKELFRKSGLGADINKNITDWSYKLIDFAKHTASLPLREYSNTQLWQLYEQNDKIHTKLYTYGWLPVAMDLFHNNFTKRLKSLLYAACPSKEEAESAFVVLTTPSKKTILAEEREDFLGIYTKYKNEIIVSLRGAAISNPKSATKQSNTSGVILSAAEGSLNKKRLLRSDALVRNETDLMKSLSTHSSKWGHLGYIYAGNVKPFGPEHYLKELRDLAASGVNADKILQKEHQQLQTAKAKQKALYKKYNISKKYRDLFTTAQGFALTKLVRRHAQLFCLYSMHTSLLPEIAKRLGRTRYQVQFMLYGEVKDGLTEGKVLSKKYLQNRFKECVLFTQKDFEAIYTGNDLKKLTKNLGRIFDKNQKELIGQTAQPGYAKGIVKVIMRAKDIHKMNKGDILVSIATDPDIVPAMKIAGAIVTEQGGITSHAAIVSRELGIPCVIGTKIATKIFKDGDMVEVDASKGIVKKLN